MYFGDVIVGFVMLVIVVGVVITVRVVVPRDRADTP